ncbi:glycosyltransferase family 2 protein [Xanthobacteraceae bacterium A53D]
MPDHIPPRWLRARRSSAGQPDLPLPLGLRLKVRRRGYAVVMTLAGGPIEAHATFRDAAGRVLASAVLTAPSCGVYIPQGAATLVLAEDVPGLRIGYYPRTKVGLKLHAFINGSFMSRSLLRRWKTAGAVARDLRGTHGALVQAGPAHQAEQAALYRRYRETYVGDFRDVPAQDAAPRLTFVSTVSTASDLEQALAALREQTDPQWAWVLLAPASDHAALAPLIAGEERARLLAAPEDAAAGFNQASAAAEGLVAPLDMRGRLSRDAVAMVRAGFAAHPECQVLYTDEERTDADGQPAEGIFKPAFNRHLLHSTDYISGLCALRTGRLTQIGGARSAAGAAWLYDLLLRACDPLPASGVRHVPRVGFTRTLAMGDGGFPAETAEDAARVLGELTGTEVTASGGRLRAHHPIPDPPPLVSFIIPTRDRANLLGLAIRSIVALTRYRHFEIVIVDNGSVEPETFALFEEAKALWPATKIVRDDGDFNYPRICNNGVAAAEGSLLCLLNNDIEVVEPGWLDELVSLASLPQTGVVGARLLFPDRSIQHAGVIVGLFAYAGHWFAHAAADAPGYEGRLRSRQNLSAVTGACLMISRACWDAIGPLDAERFAEDCNDIDLCLRAVSAGYELVWSPFSCLIHHESASRGKRRAKAHRERLKAQRARFEARWHSSVLEDPHYNPNLRRKSLYATLARAPDGDRAPRTSLIPPPAN